VVLDGVRPGGIVPFPLGVEFMKFMGRERGNAKEGMEEDL